MTLRPGGDDHAELTEYTVGAVARLLSLPVATLRSWNQRYGIGPRQHRPGRTRYYTSGDLAVAIRMAELVRAGASPASAARAASMMLEPAPTPGDTAPVIDAAERMDIARLTSLVSAHLVHYGVCDTWNRLCRPVFHTIVERQVAGQGYIDVEHILSWAVTTSLHRGIPPLVGSGYAPRVLLACAAGEQHLLPLEVLRAALAEQRCAAVFLGANLPASALADALDRRTRGCTVVLWSQSPDTVSPDPIGVAEARGATVLLAGPGWPRTEYADGRRHLASLEGALAAITGREPQ
ncbi:MerR family transcriptional regulator [Nocardia sp. CDC153]|uniref:MerR family transcriptional regulator n=1 Tax=Nocardia sp. CDC153 TaxID=3112167 RepID=UPI002DB97A8E|nr:MerR family transcriptional regulator [Nocardia sp. CDC153]MEC3953752.1 MerR family transcriptional regulator [Nocardia sp. CDC153]